MERLRIDRLGHRGDGVVEAPEGPLFAPLTLPGETIRGRAASGRLTDAEILSPSASRVAPACPHFGRCGGCALQHASDEFLAGWKTDLVAAALRARGLAAEIRPIRVSPPASRRRVVLSARRVGGRALFGFHGRADDRIVPVETCPVAHPGIEAALPGLRAIAGLALRRRDELRLAVTWTEAGLDVALSRALPLDAALSARLGAEAEAADLTRLTVDGETLALRRPPALRFGRARLVPPPGAFLQATAEGEAALIEAAREAVGPARRAADLFAGCGTFALSLAPEMAVRAVEAQGSALAALAAATRGVDGLKPVETERRDLFRAPLRPGELDRFDAVVFDPPRAGAAAQAEALAASAPSRIAAISCNPASFARDARTLVDGGFRLLWVQPVDQFRWSPHVELAAAFAREG